MVKLWLYHVASPLARPKGRPDSCLRVIGPKRPHHHDAFSGSSFRSVGVYFKKTDFGNILTVEHISPITWPQSVATTTTCN